MGSERDVPSHLYKEEKEKRRQRQKKNYCAVYNLLNYQMRKIIWMISVLDSKDALENMSYEASFDLV